MQSKKKMAILFSVITILSVIALAAPVSAQPLTVHNINTSENFGTIQGAIYDPDTTPGNTILIDSGIYNEDIVVNKTLILLGNDTGIGWPVINGTGASDGKSVTLTADGVTMERFTVWRSGSYGIFLLSNNNVLTDITVGGEDPENQDIGIYFPALIGSNGNTLTNCSFSGAERGIEIWGSSNNVFTDCTATGNSQQGIIIESNSNNNVFKGCTASSNGGSGFYLIVSSNNNSFADCTATGNGDYGFYFDGSVLSLTDNTITGCNASDNEKTGIRLEISDNTTLQDCITSDNEFDGIRILSSDNCTLSGCNITGNCNNTTFGIAGIHARGGSSDLNLTDCTISENNAHGVYLMEDSNNATITDCTFNGNDEYGISLSTCSGAVFTNSTATGNTYDGIYLTQSGNAQLTNCIASDNLRSGIYAALSDAIDFTGCTVENNEQDGFEFSFDCDDCTLMDCTATGNDRYGIQLAQFNGTTITGCTISENEWGIRLLGSTSTTLYNNFFYNTQNTYFPGTSGNCVWNTTKTSGQNILNGSYIGGNFWGTPEGTGFSQTQADADGDGFSDEPYNITVGHIDELPLVYFMTADFTAAPTSGTKPLSVEFTGTAMGSPTSWHWDFGDGSSSTLQNPSHNYTDPGTYGVSLTVSNDFRILEKTKTAYITVFRPPVPDGGGGKSNTAVDAATNLNTGDAASFNFDESAIYLVVVTAGDDISEIMITATSAGLPSSIPAPDGTAFQFIELTLYKTTDEAIGSAQIEFTVPLSWLEEEGFDPADIILYRWNDGEWQSLPTDFVKEENGNAYFTATSPGFSLFAITAAEQVVVDEADTLVATEEPAGEMTTEPAPTDTSAPAATPTPTQSPLLWAPIFALGGIFVLLRRRR